MNPKGMATLVADQRAAAANETLVPLVYAKHWDPTLGFASVACGAAACTGLLVLIVWMTVKLLQDDRRALPWWRPRPPPRGGRLLLLSSSSSRAPSVVDEGYITPRTVSRLPSPVFPEGLPSSSPTPTGNAPPLPTSHTYLLVLADDAQVPPSLQTKNYVNADISILQRETTSANGEAGYLPMKSYPSVFRIVQCEDIPLSSESLKDRHNSQMQEGKRGRPTTPLTNTMIDGSSYVQMADLNTDQIPSNTTFTFPKVPGVLQPTSVILHQQNTAQYVEAVDRSKRLPTCGVGIKDIQNRILPPPPRPKSFACTK